MLISRIFSGPLSKAQKVFKAYRSKELDFVVDAAVVANLFRLDSLQASDIVHSMADRSSGL